MNYYEMITPWEPEILVNIHFIRIFTRLREMLQTHKDILLKLEMYERKSVQQDGDIKLIFKYLKELRWSI